MTVTPIDGRAAEGPVPDAAAASADRHPTGAGRRLDGYLGAVAEALRAHGVLAGDPQRTDAADRLVGTIALDCAALAAGRSDPGPRRFGGAVRPRRSAPVLAVWDEQAGWSVGFDDDPAPHHLHPDVLPDARTVADAVVALAIGRSHGASRPAEPPAPGPPRLRLVR